MLFPNLRTGLYSIGQACVLALLLATCTGSDGPTELLSPSDEIRRDWHCYPQESSSGDMSWKCVWDGPYQLDDVVIEGESDPSGEPEEPTPDCSWYGTCHDETDPCTTNPEACGEVYYEPPPSELNPDPDGTCNDEASDLSPYSGSETSCGPPDVILVVQPALNGCPATAVFSAYDPNKRMYLSWDVRRVGDIKSKSWGGAVRYDVAHYKGTHWTSTGAPETVEGDVWCQASAGIFKAGG